MSPYLLSNPPFCPGNIISSKPTDYVIYCKILCGNASMEGPGPRPEVTALLRDS